MEFFNHILINQTAVITLIAISYLVLWHWGGLLSFGHALFVATGAYAAYGVEYWLSQVGSAGGFGVTPTQGFTALMVQEPFLIWWMLLAGLLAGGLVGALAGMVSGRWGGTPFAMISLALAELMSHIALSLPSWFGDEGGVSIDRGDFWSQGLRLEILSWSTVLLVGGVIIALGRSHWALRLQAVRENPERYTYMGGSTWAMRLSALVLSGMVAGLGGALMLLQIEHISYHAFGSDKSTGYLVYAYLGLALCLALFSNVFSGRKRSASVLLTASLIAAFLMVMGQTLLSRWTNLWGLVLGLAVMLTVLLSAVREAK